MAKSQKTKVTQNTRPIIIQEIKVGQLERGNQTIKRWMQNVKAAERVIRPNRRDLLNTYLDIDIDLHLSSVKGKRIRALKNVPWEWAGLADGIYKENLHSPWFRKALHEMGEKIFWGYRVLEFIDGEDGLIGNCKAIPPQNVNTEHKVITEYMWGEPSTGWPYTEGIYPRYILEVGEAEDLGLYAKIAPYILLKRDNLGDFARFNEMFGMPTRVYEYDPMDPTARKQVTDQAEAQGAAAYIVVPKGTVIQLLDGNKNGGSQQAYTAFHKVMNDEITVGVLGQTLTTTNDGVGSNALGNVHLQVESELAMEDRVEVEMLINYPMRKNILIPHGYPLQDIKGSFQLTEEVSMEVKLKMWLAMIDKGVKIAEEDFYEEFGVPLPNGRPVVVPPTKGAAPDPNNTGDDPDNPDDPAAPPKPKGTGKSAAGARKLAAELYAGQCKHRADRYTVSLSYQGDLDKLIEELIQKIWKREVMPGDVDPELWELVSSELMAGVDKGFGQGLSKSKRLDDVMRAALQRDVQVFSGFKNYQMLREATDLLMNETGELRAFADFRNEVLKLNADYNVNFLQAEYNHAVGAARMASKWNRFVEDKDTLPLLQYITAGDARVRASHAKFNKIILPVDHPFWDTYMPPNDWNCRCNVRQLASGEQTILREDQLPQVKDTFKFNPGKQKVIFPKTHPYYTVQAEDQGKADNNFGLKITD